MLQQVINLINRRFIQGLTDFIFFSDLKKVGVKGPQNTSKNTQSKSTIPEKSDQDELKLASKALEQGCYGINVPYF